MSLTVKEKIKAILQLLREPKVLNSIISFRSFGYLLQTGWFNSFKQGKPFDKDNNPIPWFTYPAVEFLSERLNNEMNVFEFGSGNSTLFFAERVNAITSVEHNKDWYDIISNQSPENSKIIFTKTELSKEYTKALEITNQRFDIIIVDGIYRNDCIKISLKYLSEAGIIILDDAERNDYSEGIKFLQKNGFRQIDFSGIAPGIFFRKCTTIFYKDKNCLNI